MADHDAPDGTPFGAMPEDRFHRRAVITGHVDGDTLDVEIDLGWSTKLTERLRLIGVNTPEKRGPEREAGLWVAAEVARLFPVGTPVIIESVDYNRTGNVRGKFGRTLAVVYRLADGLCLNGHLLEQRIAWPTDDDGSNLGERTLERLTGLPEDLRPRA